MRILLLALTLCAALPAQAATLRTMTLLHGPTVFLRDLFEDAGANAGRRLGAGPPPGERIVVEAPQLAAIARQFGVSWQPASRADRAVLEWAGRPLRREDALDAVRAALLTAGASPDCAIELFGFSPPIVPADATPRPVVAQLDYDSATGRFTAVLSVAGEGIDPINTRIGGHVDDTIELPVATTRLAAGTILRPEDVHVTRVLTSSVRSEVVHAAAQAIGLQLRRQVAAGQPLATSDLMRPSAVLRGGTVQVTLAVAGLAVSGQGVALESGAIGERIKVQNIGSRAVLLAEVVGPGLVRVTPNTGHAPVLANAGEVIVR